MRKIFTVLLFSLSYHAFATCTSPAGEIGTMKYFSNQFYYCNGSSMWISMTAIPNSSQGSCSKAGMLVVDKYCDGSYLYSTNSTISAGACTKANEYKYFSGKFHICIGGTWFVTGLCESCTPLCADIRNEAPCMAQPGCEWVLIECRDTGGVAPPPPNDS